MTDHATATVDLPPLLTGAAGLAAAYDRCLAGIDDDGVADAASLRFAAWLADRWHLGGPREPRVRPDAVSVDRAGIEVVRWYDEGDVVLGYVPGARGRYVVPAGEVPPGGPGPNGAWFLPRPGGTMTGA